MSAVPFSKYLPVLSSPFLWGREMPRCRVTRWRDMLRTGCNLKRMDCLFLDFPFNIFGLWLTAGNWNHRKWNYWGVGGGAAVSANDPTAVTERFKCPRASRGRVWNIQKRGPHLLEGSEIGPREGEHWSWGMRRSSPGNWKERYSKMWEWSGVPSPSGWLERKVKHGIWCRRGRSWRAL